jgi:hypothetical protein
MMIWALLLQAQAAAPPANLPAEAQQEIVVIGQRLAQWRNGVRELPNGAIQCTTVRSSGDREVDQLGCSAMSVCYREVQPALTAARQRQARDRMPAAGHPIYRQLGACVRTQNDLLTAQLAERRYQARHGMNHAPD